MVHLGNDPLLQANVLFYLEDMEGVKLTSVNHLNNKNCAIAIRMMISYVNITFWSISPCHHVLMFGSL